MQVFKGSDLNNEIIISAKKMPAVFPEGDEEWKNFIMQGSDGCFYFYQDCGDKKRGQIVSDSEMEKIFYQLAKIEMIKEFQREQALEGLMEDPTKHSILAQKLNQLDKEAIRDFLKKFLIFRESDQALVYLDGTLLSDEEAQALIQKFALIPPTRKENTREEKIAAMIEQISSHMPKDLSNQIIIECKDGQFVTRDGKFLSNEEVKIIRDKLSFAERVMEMNEDQPQPGFEIKFNQIIDIKDDYYTYADLIKKGCLKIVEGPEIFELIEVKNEQEVELQEKQ